MNKIETHYIGFKLVIMKIYLLPFLFFCFLIVGVHQTAIGQKNYATIKVDELSDAKIRELMQRAEAVSYTHLDVYKRQPAR